MVSHALSNAATRVWTSSGSNAPECSLRNPRISLPPLSRRERDWSLSHRRLTEGPLSVMKYRMPNWDPVRVKSGHCHVDPGHSVGHPLHGSSSGYASPPLSSPSPPG